METPAPPVLGKEVARKGYENPFVIMPPAGAFLVYLGISPAEVILLHWQAITARVLPINPMKVVFLLLGATILLFIFLPLFTITIASNPNELLTTLRQEEVRNAILLSLYAALMATTVGFILGIPLAYLLARHNFPGKGIIEGLVDLPIVIPHSAAGIALLFIFGRRFFLGGGFHAIGINFVGEIPGIVIAMLFVSIPFLVNSAKEGFKKVDVQLENVARTLGASPWQAFLRISLPLARGSILSGTVMMWARGISEFGAVIFLAYYPMVASILVYARLEAFGLDYAMPVAVLLILTSLAIFIILRVAVNRWETR